MSESARLLAAAAEYLPAARTEADQKRPRVAFECARHSAELAAKAILARANVKYGDTHNVARILRDHSLVPASVKARDLAKLLSEFTLGTYGFHRALAATDIADAIRIAERMVKAAAASEG